MTETNFHNITEPDSKRIRVVIGAIAARERQAVTTANHGLDDMSRLIREEADAIRETLEKAEGMSLKVLQDRARADG